MVINYSAAITGSNFPLVMPHISYFSASTSVPPVAPSTNDFNADFRFSEKNKGFAFKFQPSDSVVAKALEKLNEKLEGSTRLQFEMDNKLGIMVISILNHEGQTIRTIPTETALKIARMFAELKGCVVDDTV